MVAAAVVAAMAVWVAWPQRDHALRRRLAQSPQLLVTPAHRSVPIAPVGVMGAAVAGGAAGGPRGAALALAVGTLVATVAVLRARGQRRRAVQAERRSVAAAADSLSGLLRVGSIPAAALASLAEEQPALAEAAAEHEIGGDVVAALQRAALRPGREGLSDLAAAWHVAAKTGASLERAVDVIADDLHNRQERDATVRVELAASRLASRLLGVLPLVGIWLGYAFGGDPVAFLTGNPVGLACLVAAAGLVSAGLIWTDSLAARAGR